MTEILSPKLSPCSGSTRLPPPLNFGVEKSAGKVMATVFWDEKGLLFLEFMPQKTTITGQSYANQLPLCERPSKRKGEESSQQACCSFMTTRQCTSAKSQAAIQQCGFQQLNHPPYSPDLAPSDYFLFRVMKKFLRGKRFSRDEEVKEAVTTWFKE